MRARPDKDHAARIQPVNQQQVAFGVALAVIGPFTAEYVIQRV